MKHSLQTLIATTLIFVGVHATAGEHASREEAVAMVKKLTQAIKTDGKETLIKDVNTPNGKYAEKDIYVTIETVEGVTLANNTAPRMVGKNVTELRDADGKYFVKERNEVLKSKPMIWTELKWPNPATSKTDTRLLYAVV